LKTVENSLLVEEMTKNARAIRQNIREGKRNDFVNAAEIQLLEQFSDIVIRFVEIDGLVKVMLEIGDNTTHKDIRDAIPNILRWRDEVQKWQSDKIAAKLFHEMKKPTNKEEFLEFFSYSQEHGVSYSKLAERFNENMSRVVVKLAEYHGKTISTEELIEFHSLNQYANSLLSMMNIKDISIEDALEQVAKGNPPFEKGYPVSRYKMIEVLRTWRKNKQHIRVNNVLKKAKELAKKRETGKV